MNPEYFLKTIYLGDRQCQGLIIDEQKKEIKIKIDCISRVKGDSWDYYIDEDVANGFLVFENVKKCKIEIDGVIPNAWVEVVSISPLDEKSDYFYVEISLGAVDEMAISKEIILSITSNSIAIEREDGVMLRE